MGSHEKRLGKHRQPELTAERLAGTCVGRTVGKSQEILLIFLLSTTRWSKMKNGLRDMLLLKAEYISTVKQSNPPSLRETRLLGSGELGVRT